MDRLEEFPRDHLAKRQKVSPLLDLDLNDLAVHISEGQGDSRDDGGLAASDPVTYCGGE